MNETDQSQPSVGARLNLKRGSSGGIERLDSLDALRGAIVAAMIAVNSPGDPNHVYRQLAHAPWHGLTVADVIAPCFMWVVGVTTALSLGRRLRSGAPRLGLLRPIARRAFLLYSAGVIVTALPAIPSLTVAALATLKLMGILERIALCYFLGSAIFLVTKPPARVLCALALTGGYWAVVVSLSGQDYLLPTGRNVTQTLDLMLLGAHAESSSHALLTVFAATATVLLGTVAGDWLLAGRTADRKAVGLVVAGLFGICLGLALAQWMPINRRLWTPSFCLLTAGLSASAYGVSYWAVEVLQLRRGLEWLMAYGANPFFIFVLSEAGRSLMGMRGASDSAGRWRPFWAVASDAVRCIVEPTLASFIVAISYTALFGMLALLMYRKRWVVTV